MTDDALTDAEPEQQFIQAFKDLERAPGEPAKPLPWSTAEALHQTGYVAPSPYIYGLEDLPPIGVRRGGIRFPRMHVIYAIKRLGWRRWHVRASLPGDGGIFSFGPFPSRKRAESAQSDLRRLLQQVDYIYTYKTGA